MTCELPEKKRTMTKRLNILALIAIVIIGGFMMLQNNDILFQLSDNEVIVSGPGGSGFSIAVKDIVFISKGAVADIGTLTDGKIEKDIAYGLWRNDLWGEYKLCINPKLTSVIIIETAESAYAFNYTNDEVTEALYQELASKFNTGSQGG